MIDIFLTKSEIYGLTNRLNQSAQIRALKTMGIEHKVRPDGSVAILRDHITKIFGGIPDPTRRVSKIASPNWDAFK